VLPNGPALSCGTDKFQVTENETSSLYQLSIKHKTYARNVNCTQLATVSLSAWLGGAYLMIPSVLPKYLLY
jgi:hypothetical protein